MQFYRVNHKIFLTVRVRDQISNAVSIQRD